ncbi:TUT7/ZCCHC6-like protein, partial [Leptotrombidium deliense]
LEFERLGFYRMPPRFCRLCRKQGHSQSHCPLERKVELVEIPNPMPENHKCILNHIIDLLFNESRLKPEDEKKHAAVLLSLAVFIRKSQYFEDSNLELFGSTKNGFGAWDCDLDICLTFKSNITGEGIDQADIIIKLFELLSKHPDVQSLIPITQAKVPILKFDFVLRYQDTSQKYECDISLYNRLALYNTKLLRTYCEIDERVRKLGFIVKYFAKTCEIGDASRGSLSSYAYTLMTLHYLQQCNPPVIPVLQEMYEGIKPECMIDGCNTWFYEDYQNIPNIWKHFRTNNLSVAELFVGFLRYFSETFDFGKHVVCINQLQSLCKLKKMWTGKRIAIEDPFLVTHNLGQGVDDHMAVFIKTAICKGRNVIGRPPDELPHRCPNWKLYFFDKDRLTIGNLPTGRGCRHCGKIGHKMSECPILLEKKKANRTQNRRNRNQIMNEAANVLNLQTQRNERFHEMHEQQRVHNTQNYNHHQHEYGFNQRQRNENQNHQHTNDMFRERRHANVGRKGPSAPLRKPRHNNQ